MRKIRLCLTSVIASVAASAATLASAAGLGAGGSGAVLGRPLDFVVQVRLEPGESLGPECVSADVMAGQRRLPASQVRASIERQGGGSARIRIATTSAMDEPVIAIELGVGCQIRLSRNYIVLADPPDTATGAAMPMAAAPAFAAAPVDVNALSRSAAAGSAVAGAAAPALPALPVAAPAPSPRPPPPPPAPPPKRAEAAPAPRIESRPAPRPQRRAERPTPTRPAASAAARTATAAAPPARLRLDFIEPVPAPDASAAVIELALEAVAQATSAARAQAAAASATAARIAYLERNIERLTKEINASRSEATELREQVERGPGTERWLLPLTLLVLLLSALTAWLAWRLSGLQRDRRQVWHEALAPVPERAADEAAPSRVATSPIPFVTSEIKMPAAATAAGPARTRGTPAWPSASPPEARAPQVQAVVRSAAEQGEEPPTQRTEPLAVVSVLDGATARDVSIEELIDLEQQAEFFLVLGQEDAAIDLLVQHLRDTGGGSPLPYLKLLEIHHGRGDRSAYERMRTRFNHRFNAYAPEWGADLQAGRSLDDYAGVVPRLQQVWARPLDAMAELEALLFRKSRGELFDLPAYREVLFLYALARDLLDRDAVDPHNVDLLLPLADGGEFSSTAPAPFTDIDGAEAEGHGAKGDHATAPVDLDLSQDAPPDSIFDALQNTAQPPRP